MKRIVATLVLGASMLGLTACSDDVSEESASETAPSQTYTVKSSISSDPDPEVRQAENAAIMDHMYDDDNVPADLLPGEAFRRGVPLDQARLDAKIARQAAGSNNAANPPPPPPPPLEAPVE